MILFRAGGFWKTPFLLRLCSDTVASLPPDRLAALPLDAAGPPLPFPCKEHAPHEAPTSPSLGSHPVPHPLSSLPCSTMAAELQLQIAVA